MKNSVPDATAQPDFGQRLRAIRLQRGMSQSELANGVADPSYVSMLESGKREPSLEIIVQLAARLGVPPMSLTDSGSVLTIQSERTSRDNQYLALSIRAQGYVELGDLDAARELYEEVLRLAELEGNRHWLLSSGMSLEGILQMLGDNKARYQLLSDLDSVAGTQLPDVQFKVKTSLADAAWDTGLLRQAEGHVRLALDLLLEAGLRGTTEHVRVLGMLIVLRCDLGDWEGNEDFIDQMIAAAAQGGRIPTVGWAHWSAMVACTLMEQHEQALRHLAEAESLATKFVSRGEWAWFCRSAAASLLAADADLGLVRNYLEQAEQVLRHNSFPGQRSRLQTVWARFELVAGRAEQSERLCTELLEMTDPVLTPIDRARLLVVRSHALAQLGRRDEAAEQMRTAASTFENLGAFRWSARAWRDLDALQVRSG